MTRKEALRLVNELIDPNTPMEDRELAAARLTEFIKMILPEEE